MNVIVPAQAGICNAIMPNLRRRRLCNARETVNERKVHNRMRGSVDHRGVDPEGVDLPVSICKCLGVLVDD